MVSYNIPMEIIGIVLGIIMALIGAVFYFGTYWYDMRKKNPELDVFLKARKPPYPPIISMVDLSGRMFCFVGEKDKPHDVKFKKDDFGLLLDPRFASKAPRTRLEDGTTILFYGTNFHFPLDLNGARAIVQTVKKIRHEYPELDFIRDDIVLLELLTKEGEDLYHDVREVLHRYPQEIEEIEEPSSIHLPKIRLPKSLRRIISKEEIEENENAGVIEPQKETDKTDKTENADPETETEAENDIPIEDIAVMDDTLTEDDIVEIVEEIKAKLKQWKIEPGFFSLKEGLELLPIGTTSTDMKRVETITKINTQNEIGYRPTWEDTAKFIGIVVAIIVVAYMVISALKPPG